ncbi:putative skp1 [Hibiscus syriacus]|uniref:Skp1 n=2 Tax=Hibiscus syriacus TaxID=106335 RepID=A0A6A3ATR4_HIBSY|nr:putative skp1 [Hibiscus syriacus]
MKLRDQQDKVERLLSFYKTSKDNPFRESITLLRGEVDFLGAVLFMPKVDEEHWDGVDRAGIETGVDSKFRFETIVGDKDSVGIEFVADRKRVASSDGDVNGTPLSLSKLFYKANATNWFSAIAIPFGAQVKDLDVASDFYLQDEKGLTGLSLGPPLLHQQTGSAIGVTMRMSNIIASLAQSVSGMRNAHCLSSFGQVVCQFPLGFKLSVLGLHQWPKLASCNIHLEALAIPFGLSRPLEDAYTTDDETSSPPLTTNNLEFGSIALKLESEFGAYKRLSGWIEMKQATPKHFEWAVNFFDTSEDVYGWGMSLGGVEIPGNCGHFQVESYVKFNPIKTFSLKPGVAYIVDGNSQTMAIVLRSNWSL